MPTPKFTVALVCTLLCTTIFAQQKGTYTDMRDGKIYKTTKIVEQVWMAENLNYEASGSKCYKDNFRHPNEAANCKKYGRLYDWYTAMKACPGGWHLPSQEEWKILIKAVGGEKTAGKYLKATSSWYDYKGKSGNGEDTFGFSALPGGDGFPSGSFDYAGCNGHWWSSSDIRFDYEIIGDQAAHMIMDCQGEDAFILSSELNFLMSVRCIQDHAPPKGSAK